MNHKELGIYIHIPFCVKKCLYCDFISGPATEETKVNYVNRLLKEIEIQAEYFRNCTISTVFIGGGTPSVLRTDLLALILCKLKEKFVFEDDYECTIEVNPGTVDFVKLQEYRKAGINRLSIGLQSCHDKELKALGRIHDYSAFEDTYRMAREAGFENINVDLMSSVPEQTRDSFIRSLKTVVELEPEHISVYSLIVEEGTPFYDMDLNLPDEDEERKIYYDTGRVLQEYGYAQYEISNYAKKGRECRHNIRYWQCKEYIGFGVAAASFYNGVRWKNTEELHTYLQTELCDVINRFQSKVIKGVSSNLPEDCFLAENDFYEEVILLSENDKMAEFMFMGLRMNEGVSKTEFVARFGCGLEEKYGPVIEKHIQNDLLEKVGDFLRLTDKGRDVCNFVMADFLISV